jgi:hypothetical protein
MLLIAGSARDPLTQDFNFVRAERCAGIVRGHTLLLIDRHDSPNQFTGRRLTRDNHCAFSTVSDCTVSLIQPQIGLTSSRIRSVATKTPVRQNRSHITIVLHILSLRAADSSTHQGNHKQLRHAPARTTGVGCPHIVGSLFRAIIHLR